MSLSKRIKEAKETISRNENIFTSGSTNLQILENQIQIMLSLQEVLVRLEDLEDDWGPASGDSYEEITPKTQIEDGNM